MPFFLPFKKKSCGCPFSRTRIIKANLTFENKFISYYGLTTCQLSKIVNITLEELMKNSVYKMKLKKREFGIILCSSRQEVAKVVVTDETKDVALCFL
jgi:hypothetical protein